MRGEESSDSESGRMEESSIRSSLETLCQELNMDEQTATEAMENFTAIWNTYTLEVKSSKQCQHVVRHTDVRACMIFGNSYTLTGYTSVQCGTHAELKGLHPAIVFIL